MRRFAPGIAITALLLAGGFAAASIASGGGLGLSKTGTVTSTTSHKQLMCHKTHSKKKPWVQISVDQHAVQAHLKHGDTLGPCSASQLSAAKKKSKNGKNSTKHAAGQHGNGGGHGNSGGHGNGKG